MDSPITFADFVITKSVQTSPIPYADFYFVDEPYQ